MKEQSCTPLKKRVILPALAAIILLAAAVCALHRINAVSLRGTATVGDYTRTDGAAENLVPLVEDPWKDAGIIHIRGALLRMDQAVGAVNVRVGLIPERTGEGAPAAEENEAILLNTQMVRRSDLAQAYGVDDHCGFHAAADEKLLERGKQYRVVLADETDGAMRMVETGMTVAPIDGGLAFMRVKEPEEEARHAQ